MWHAPLMLAHQELGFCRAQALVRRALELRLGLALVPQGSAWRLA